MTAGQPSKEDFRHEAIRCGWSRERIIAIDREVTRGGRDRARRRFVSVNAVAVLLETPDTRCEWFREPGKTAGGPAPAVFHEIWHRLHAPPITTRGVDKSERRVERAKPKAVQKTPEQLARAARKEQTARTRQDLAERQRGLGIVTAEMDDGDGDEPEEGADGDGNEVD